MPGGVGDAGAQDALAIAFRFIARKFPRYSFEELLDKSPQWLEWAAYQAAMTDVDMVRKAGAALNAISGTEKVETLADMGIGKA